MKEHQAKQRSGVLFVALWSCRLLSDFYLAEGRQGCRNRGHLPGAGEGYRSISVDYDINHCWPAAGESFFQRRAEISRLFDSEALPAHSYGHGRYIFTITANMSQQAAFH
jgi:hypothetical protein